MPSYKAKSKGFFGGTRIYPGQTFYSEDEVKGEWFELVDAEAEAPPKKKARAKKGPAVAEGMENAVGVGKTTAETSSDVDVI